MYMSTLVLPGVKAVLNFSGGRLNHAQGQSANFENKMMIEGWRELGSQAKIPVMLVFTENDSLFTPNTVRKSTFAFNESGGKAELLLLPPIVGNGHFIDQWPQFWTNQVRSFLRRHNLGPPTQAMSSATEDPNRSTATVQSHPALFDMRRFPIDQEECKSIYIRFLFAPLPRYFAIGHKGKGCGFSLGYNSSADKAMKFCEDRVGTCRLYAKDNELIPPDVR